MRGDYYCCGWVSNLKPRAGFWRHIKVWYKPLVFFHLDQPSNAGGDIKLTLVFLLVICAVLAGCSASKPSAEQMQTALDRFIKKDNLPPRRRSSSSRRRKDTSAPIFNLQTFHLRTNRVGSK
jgi:hypothetical protein